MNLIPRWTWLHQVTRRSPADAAEDAAEMGTAFGLDASFGETPEPRPEPRGTPATHQVSPFTGLPRS